MFGSSLYVLFRGSIPGLQKTQSFSSYKEAERYLTGLQEKLEQRDGRIEKVVVYLSDSEALAAGLQRAPAGAKSEQVLAEWEII